MAPGAERGRPGSREPQPPRRTLLSLPSPPCPSPGPNGPPRARGGQGSGRCGASAALSRGGSVRKAGPVSAAGGGRHGNLSRGPDANTSQNSRPAARRPASGGTRASGQASAETQWPDNRRKRALLRPALRAAARRAGTRSAAAEARRLPLPTGSPEGGRVLGPPPGSQAPSTALQARPQAQAQPPAPAPGATQGLPPLRGLGRESAS